MWQQRPGIQHARLHFGAGERLFHGHKWRFHEEETRLEGVGQIRTALLQRAVYASANIPLFLPDRRAADGSRLRTLVGQIVFHSVPPLLHDGICALIHGGAVHAAQLCSHHHHHRLSQKHLHHLLGHAHRWRLHFLHC